MWQRDDLGGWFVTFAGIVIALVFPILGIIVALLGAHMLWTEHKDWFN